MRASTAVAVLILAAGVAPSVALPLPASTSGHAARALPAPMTLNKPLPLTPPPPPLEPLRGPANPNDPKPGVFYSTTPESPPQQSGLKKIWNKLFGRTLIASTPSDEVFGQPNSRRELLGRFDELLIELAARAYEEESLTTPIDDLD